jgi:RNA polymerase sigma-70 factor (ECF subfamily)
MRRFCRNFVVLWVNLMLWSEVYLFKACDKGMAVGGPPLSVESRLIRRLQRGDLAALGELYELFKDNVYRTALAITRDEHAAEDILQECFVRLYHYAASIDTERPLKPWLYRVAVNLSYDWFSRKPMLQPLDDVLEWLSGLSSVFPAPDRKTEERELHRMVRDVVAELPMSHQAVVVLFYQENLSLEEVAEVVDLPVGTVKSRLHHARKRLRDALAQRQRPVPEMTYEFT